MNLRGLDHYERRAIHDIRAWVAGDRGMVGRGLPGLGDLAGRAARPLERAFDAAMRDTRVGRALDNALQQLTEGITTYMATATPMTPALEAYGVDDADGIAGLHLREIDAQLRRVRDRHRSLFVGMGAVEGVASLAGTPTSVAAFVVSIPGMQASSLRAVADLSRYAGYDPGLFEERQFIAEVALRSLEVGGRGHHEAVSRLLALGQQVATRQALDQLQQYAIVAALREQSQRYGVALTQRRAAALLPMVGALVGAGFNAVHAERLLGGATMLYRARHLADVHDLDLSELIGMPQPAP